jgi:hypothetical protein
MRGVSLSTRRGRRVEVDAKTRRVRLILLVLIDRAYDDAGSPSSGRASGGNASDTCGHHSRPDPCARTPAYQSSSFEISYNLCGSSRVFATAHPRSMWRQGLPQTITVRARQRCERRGVVFTHHCLRDDSLALTAELSL